MYLRPVFAETDPGRIDALIAAHSFGVLATHHAGAITASHLPFAVRREDGVLVLDGHLAAANPQCAAFAGGEATAIFGGPHAYISPGWYATQPAVPTWDYVAVHVSGRLELVEDAGEVRAMLRALAAHDPTGYDMTTAPPAFMAGMLRGIRAFRLRAERVEAQWKMSQNRSVLDRQQVVAALMAQGQGNVAALIAATLPRF